MNFDHLKGFEEERNFAVEDIADCLRANEISTGMFAAAATKILKDASRYMGEDEKTFIFFLLRDCMKSFE